MNTVVARYSLAAVALLAAFVTSAGVYKWEDDQGRVHYGDLPAGDVSTQEIEIDEAPSAAPASDSMDREEKRRRLLEAMQEERYEKEANRAAEKAERERDHRKCIRYRDRMRQYESAGRMYTLDRDGNRVYMSTQERDRAMQDLRASISKYCH